MTTVGVEVSLALFSGNLDELTVSSMPYLVLLAVMTGTAAHGFIVYAQHTVPVGTISIMQVAQPALAVVWAYLILDQSIRSIQVVGMVLVLVGLAFVVTLSRRPPQPDDADDAGPPAPPVLLPET